MNKHIVVTILVVALIVIAGVGYKLFHVEEFLAQPARGADVTVKVLVGGEKMAFLANPKVIARLKSKYGLTIDASKVGSIDMVASTNPGVDALWPSSQIASELFRLHGGVPIADETIFNSAIVMYASTTVADALVAAKIAEKRDGSVYVIDCKKLFETGDGALTWVSLNLPRVNGKVKVYSSDPQKTNSGLMFAALLANILNGGEVVTDKELPGISPKVNTYFKRLGTMERSTSDLFQSFLSNPMFKPIIVGYENQIVEYALQHPEHQVLLRSQIQILYPVPTVWSSHPFIALTSNGKRVIEALKDPEIQKIAWEEHGFRSGLLGATNDPRVLTVGGIPKTVDSIIPVPSALVMQKIMDGLSEDVSTTVH